MNTNSNSSPYPPTSSLQKNSALSPWLYSLFVVFLLTILFASHFINDTDLGFHLKSGQWILENLRFPATDTYTYTLSGKPFLDIHWFYQVCLYLLFSIGNYPLVDLFHVLLITSAFLIVLKRLRLAETPLWLCTFLLLTAVMACEIRFRARPEIASWLFLSLTLWVLDHRTQKKADFLFLLPLIQLLWVNMEGLFVLGWAAMGAYLVSGYFHSHRLDKKLLRYSGLAALAGLVNPYFLRGLLFPLSNWATMTYPLIRNSIKELQSPWLATPTLFSAPTLYLLIYKLFAIALLILVLFTFRKRKVHELLLLIIFFGLSASTFRNIPLFFIACLPLTAACWMDLEWAWLKKLREGVLTKPIFAWMTTALILCLSLRVMTGAFYISDRRTERFGLGLDRHTLPVDACEFLLQNHLDGRILNQLDDGGWLDWKGPQKVFIDCRLDPYPEYMASFDPGGLTRLADQTQANILFFSNLNGQWISQLQNQPNWRPVYLDESTVIYLKKGYSDQIPGLDYDRLASGLGIPQNILSQAPTLLGSSPSSGPGNFLNGFVHAPSFPNDLLNMGIFYGYNGQMDKAEPLFLEAIRRTEGKYYDFYFNLGLIYESTRRHDDAVRCMKRVLMENPGDPLARQITGL